MKFLPANLRRFVDPLLGRLRRRGRFTVFAFTLGTIFLTGIHLTFFTSLLERRTPEAPRAPVPAAASIMAEPVEAKEAVRTVEGRVRKGTGFADNLAGAGLSAVQVREVVREVSPLLDFRRLRAGDLFTLSLGPGENLRRFTYRTGPLEEIVLERGPGEWRIERRHLPHETRVETVTGTIESSLFEALEKLGEKDRLTMDFVDIFAWDIDFANELQRGDTFGIVVEKIFRDGAFITYGRILGAEYRDRDELHQAFFFPYPPGRGDYYAPDGKSLRKTFLKAPVSYSRISSGYSRRRLHPVLKKVKPHLGIDYAAPTGTPVWAPADGVVVSATRDRRNGRKVVLRHPNGYTTYFLHLSRFARGIRKGHKVRQKEVVGYVGSSGLSTGPHLDYRMKKNGSWRNPLREKFPPGKSLPEEFQDKFAEYQDWLTGERMSPAGSFLTTVKTEDK
jgi:murein DD-endopeptidase MepM/ murein hydrolase activator NlpD